MTNGERYKTQKERSEAFRMWCENHRASNCPSQVFAWLDAETEVEEQWACPFCGMVCDISRERLGFDSVVWCVKCRDPLCGYRSAYQNAKTGAIIAHNNVAKAVKGAK